MLFLLDSFVPFMHLISSTCNYMNNYQSLTLQYVQTKRRTLSPSLIKMDQYSQYLFSVKSSHSWEEQAFAEDAQGPLGGFVWPPRSYSCSFCRREFRSAQALGGHMNVHRREKAKFKESVNGTALQIPYSKSLRKGCLDPGNFPYRVSSIPALGQESIDSSFDTKSCICDEGLVVARGLGDVETNLGLGFDLDSCLNVGGGKRRKKNHVTPPITGGLDLELRLAS